MDKRKIALAVLSTVLACLIAFLGVALVMHISGGSQKTGEYETRMALGKKYLSEGNYNAAVAVYKRIIQDEPDKEDAYIELIMLYDDMEMEEEAVSLLNLAAKKFRSSRIRNLYGSIMNEPFPGDQSSGDVITPVVNESEERKITISPTFCETVANYTFSDYLGKVRSTFNKSSSGGTYTYRSDSLGWTLLFFDEGSSKLIDPDHMKPYDKVRPNYIKVDDLSQVFIGFAPGEKINSQKLIEMGASAITSTSSSGLGHCVRFEYKHCIFEIATDTNGEFTTSSDNRIYSSFGTDSAEVNDKFDGEIRVISVTTGKSVDGVSVSIRKDGESGSIADEVTGYDGCISVSLGEGDYIASLQCDGYISEDISFTVYTSGMYSTDVFSISPELTSGQIRIVLEWGSYPEDLDAYYMSSDRRGVVSYYNPEFYDGDQLVAKIDVDARNGYGPETITVFDVDRDFRYSVCDFYGTGTLFTIGDITVKVYLPGDSSPTVYTPPFIDTNDEVWIVFEYSDGRLFELGDHARASAGGSKN